MGTLRSRLAAPLLAARDDMRRFREAYREAPEPNISWDILGARSMFRRAMPLLLKEHASPGRMAAAVFIGTLVGCSPLYGLHYIIVIFIAVFLRLNKLVTWLATNISFPAFAPVVAFSSIQIGSMMTTGTFVDRSVFETASFTELTQRFFVLWLIGGTVFGTAAGAALAVPTYVLLKRTKGGPFNS